jgi:uncharacterized protein YbaP (TraB family)
VVYGRTLMKMRKDVLRILLSFFILFSFCFVVCEQVAVCQDQKNFLWKVQSEGNTVYVLGSIHVMRQEDYPLHENIEDAFRKSDILAVEANINDIAKIDLQTLMEKALYPENETLKDHVSQETYEILKKETERLGLPLMLLERQKPWFLALSLTSMEILKLGLNPSYGIDMHFMSEASGKKKIVELESLEYQFDLLSSFDDDEQESFLLYTLRDLKVLEQELQSMIDAWKSGDTETLESIMKKSTSGDIDMSSVYEKLITERNRNMAGKIEEYLEDDKTYFIIVGAGHLVGKKGIIEILKDKGYTVKQL